MSLGKRHIGRRVAGVGVAVTLMVLGLEATPAFAAEPTVGTFSPTSGPAAGGCVLVLTGTGFDDFPDTGAYDVNFLDPANAATPATDRLVIDDATLWIESPALTAGTEYTIEVITHAGGTPAETTSTFLATTGAGACAPTITSFTPTCGLTNTTVVITGTNLIQPGFVGADVFFNPYGAGQEADHTVPDVDDVTSLSVIQPSGSADGPISVDTGVTTNPVFSSASYLVPPPDCTPVTAGHARSISFKLKKSGKASGVVKSTEDPAFTACVSGVPVKIQKKKKGGGWKTLKNVTTSDTGSYSSKVKPKKGKYRALAPKVAGATTADDCLKAKSGIRKLS
ncbi:MAG TPA: IPT/TIG domain-containing protein [Acidimicrobiia bacterium]|nr:IPT/TIG domain-containing protein [Acidimicrobiia bacterium]